MSFHVGQLVVCVETWVPTAGYGWGDEVGPTRGTIYTIRDFDEDDPSRIRLVEIINPDHYYTFPDGSRHICETSFGVRRFRPLDESKLEIFRKMLVSPRRRVDA